MSLQWTFIATFLYAEIFIVVLFLLPFISASRWQKVFRSRLMKCFKSYANIYFNIFVLILVVLFFDSIRDMRKYMARHEQTDVRSVESSRLSIDAKMFRSQRNFYICGITLFLWFVLRRMVTLISQTATLEANVEASQKQAEGASAMAKKLMEEKENKDNEKEEIDPKGAEVAKELESTKTKLGQTREELDRTKLDLDTMKKQAESTNKEYDRLLKEHETLQEELKKLDVGEDTKKDN